MAMPPNPPKKPAGQGGKAPAYVQPVNHQEKAASNTNGLPAGISVKTDNWADHAQRSNPRGVKGSGKGAR